MENESQAWLCLFLTIITHNGYYEKLRSFMKDRGYNFEDMASMLYNEYEKAPDGMSPYYYMDSMEDLLTERGYEDFRDIREIVDCIYNEYLWKE